jgi:hypothetical protein
MKEEVWDDSCSVEDFWEQADEVLEERCKESKAL